MESLQRSVAGEYAAELLFFLFKVGESLLEPTLRMYIYDGVCSNHFPDDDTCSHLHLHPDNELVVQNSASRYMMYYKLLLNFPAMVMVLFCGAWSDKGGRKIPVMLTCFGTCVSVIVYMLSDSVYTYVPYMPLVLVGAAIRGIFGRSAVMTMAVHSYVSDYSEPERRTTKLSSLVATSHFGYLFGSLTAGVCLERFGFTAVFLTVIIIQTLVVVIACACMRDEHTGGNQPPKSDQLDKNDPRTPLLNKSVYFPNDSDNTAALHKPINNNQKPEKKEICSNNNEITVGGSASDISPSVPLRSKGGISDISPSVLLRSVDDANDIKLPVGDYNSLMDHVQGSNVKQETPEAEDCSHSSSSKGPISCFCRIFDSFSVCMRPRKSIPRCTLVVLFCVVYLQQANKSGETDVLLLFTKRSPLNLSKAWYGYLLAASYASLGFFAFVVPRLMSWAKITVRDTTLALIGSSFKVASLAVLATSSTQSVLFIGSILGGPHSLTISAAKSMISKICSEKDLGKAFSLLSSGETLSNLLGTIFYTNMYSITLPIYPGLVFIIELCLYVLIFLLFSHMAVGFRQRKSKSLHNSASPQSDRSPGYGAISDLLVNNRRPESVYISP